MIFDLQKRLLRRVALALALAAGCGAASASILHVSINTSKFGATNGYIDMEFSAIAGAPLATAMVSNLVGLAATPDIQWGVDQVSGGYEFRNDTLNLLSHAAVFGGIVSFDLAITGTSSSARNGSMRRRGARASPSTSPSRIEPLATSAMMRSLFPTSIRTLTFGVLRTNSASSSGSTYEAIVVLAPSTSSPPSCECPPRVAVASSRSDSSRSAYVRSSRPAVVRVTPRADRTRRATPH